MSKCASMVTPMPIAGPFTTAINNLGYLITASTKPLKTVKFVE